MRRYHRRQFLAMAGGLGVASLAAACADDGDGNGGGATEPSGGASPAAATATVEAGEDAGAVGLQWFGQSMFVLTSPGGTRVLLDPFNDIGYTVPPPLNTEAATITHEHPDHNNDSLGGTAQVLRGLTQDGWAEIDQEFGDVRLFTVRSYHDETQGSQRGRNAIFVYETGGLRVVHLGDLGHQLTDEQLAPLGGPVHVLMAPVGGAFTIDAAAATEVVNQLQPKIVFPMHYKTDRIVFPLATVDAFLEGKQVERVGSTTTRISASELPEQTVTRVLDYE